MALIRVIQPNQIEGRAPSEFKDIHKGERCWIIGNGPSARDWTLEEIRELGGTVIGINRSWKGSSDGKYKGFRESDYHVMVSGTHAFELCSGAFTTGVAFAPKGVRQHVYKAQCNERDQKRFCFVGVLSGGYSLQRFRYDIDKGIMTKFAGYFAAQVAAYMGFSTWMMVGFSCKDREGHSYDDHPEHGIITRDGHRRWWRGVAQWAEANGVRVINCDPGSAIEWFEKMSKAEASRFLRMEK